MKDGKSYQEIAREIRERFKRDGKFSGKVAGPRHVCTRAELVAVTETGHAYEAAPPERALHEFPTVYWTHIIPFAYEKV